MMGSERFSDYTGYSDSFCFGGDHQYSPYTTATTAITPP
jgi:hypothetical protein